MGKSKKTQRPRLLSLCSGIGGIDLAAEMAGWEIAGQCEIDAYCQRVLARHWPDVKLVGDIRSVWGDTFDVPIHGIVAGFPCPPVSVAGKRRGADDARWLWPEVLRVIQIYEPAWVVLENVAGLISLGLDSVLADLDAAGYESWPVVFPAAAVGAPHPRERVFVVANANGDGRSQPQGHVCEVGRWPVNSGEDVAHANCDRRGDGARESLCFARSCGTSDVGSADAADVADTAGARLPWRRQTRRSASGTQAGAVLELEPQRRSAGATQSRMGRDADGLPRRLDGRDAGDRLIPPRHGWPVGRGQAQYPWEPPRTTTERIPHRAARLKALGNAVVPQQVYPILAAIAAVIEEEA